MEFVLQKILEEFEEKVKKGIFLYGKKMILSLFFWEFSEVCSQTYFSRCTNEQFRMYYMSPDYYLQKSGLNNTFILIYFV
jgi:hypothetical protein